MPAPEPPAPPTPEPAPPPAPLIPQMSVEEEQRLLTEAQRTIDEAERTLEDIGGRELRPADQEAYLNARTFLDQARMALGTREYQRATNLAAKARALANDLVRSRAR